MKPTPDQERAITTIDRDVCVDAGAGSGKTRVLVGRILYILQQKQAKLDEIVAITFTDKAASEMKERLRRSCREHAPSDNPERMTFWRDIERRVDTARISTIHGFCMNLLKQNAFNAGLDPEFATLTEADSHLLRDETIQEALHALLNEQDPAATRLAVELGTARLAGTLRDMLNRAASFEEAFTTSTYASAEELARRWEEWVAPRRQALWNDLLARLKAVEGCCEDGDDKCEVLRRTLVGILEGALAAEDHVAMEASLAGLEGLNARGGSKKKWSSEDAMKSVKEVLADLRETAAWFLDGHALGPVGRQSAQLVCDLVSVYKRVYESFAQTKRARNAYTFDDLILEALHLLREDGEVRARVARGIKHLLIDEFQDTDSRQLEIARLLTAEPEGPRLFIVGDAKQSIYRFRGAEVEVFGNAREDTQEHIVLKDNFRTLPDVIEFVNDAFARTGLLERIEPEYRRLEPFRGLVSQSRVEVFLVQAEDGASTADYREREAEMVARRILAMCTGETRVTVEDADTGQDRPAEFGDVAMLFRSTKAVYLYEKALKDLGIPYVVVAGAGFYERQEVADLRNLLRAVMDPMDEVALLGLLRSPIVGLSDEALVRFRQGGGPGRMLETGIPAGEPEADRIAACRDLLSDLRAHTEMRLPDFLRYVLQRTNYEAILLGQDHLGVQKALNVRKVADLADGFSSSGTPRLSAFVRHMDDMTREAIREGEATAQAGGTGAVTLMTVHKSKGLEFPVVFLPDMTRGSTSSNRDTVVFGSSGLLAMPAVNDTGESVKPEIIKYSESDERELEAAEHARILYVAMTRARDWLILSGSPEAQGAGKSWFADLDGLFGFTELDDGAEESGEKWCATIRHEIPRTATQRSEAPPSPTPLPEALQARTGAVFPTCAARRTFSVTELLPLMSDGPHEPVRAPAQTAASSLDAGFRGTMTHRFFELWDFAAEGPPPVQAFLQRECPDARFHEELAPSLEATARRFMDTALYRALRTQAGLEREQAFTLRVGDALVTGVMDAVLDDGTIVDYKTGRRTPEKETQYRLQLSLYAAAMHHIRGVTPPSACLCYLDAETAGSMVHDMEMTAALSDDAMERAHAAIARLRGDE